MNLFGIRQGVEFFATYDPLDQRNPFIQNFIEESQLDLYLESLWDTFNAQGSICFYLRPIGNKYDLLWFGKSEFEAFYDGPDLERVVIKYSYEKKQPFTNISSTKWVRLDITKDKILESENDSDPGLIENQTPLGQKSVVNTLERIPCIIIDNNPRKRGKRGVSDFEWLAGQIEEHNSMLGSINENIRFFGNPTLVSTRSEQQMLESGTVTMRPDKTASSAAGFVGPGRSSTKYINTQGNYEQGSYRIKKVVGDVERDERFGYIQPDAVGGDINRWVVQYEEAIRTAMGGVAENGINAGATAFEIKSLFGRAAATAKRKAKAIYDYGLCKLLKLAISIEESYFRQSFKLVTKWNEEKDGPLTDQIIRDYIFGGPETKPQGMPEGVVGLVPMGNLSVQWRWKGPVFEDSPQDKLQTSILGRNLAEEGVNTTEVFKVLFPDKTEEEIEAMLGGVPFRRTGQIMGTLQQMLGLIGQLGSIPDPLNPNAPLVFRYDLTPMIGQVLSKLNEELSHGRLNGSPDSDESSAYGIPSIDGGTNSDALSALTSANQYGISNLTGLHAGSGLPWLPGAHPSNAQLPVRTNPNTWLLSAQPGSLPPGASPGSAPVPHAGFSGAATAMGTYSPAVQRSPVPVSGPARAVGIVPPTIGPDGTVYPGGSSFAGGYGPGAGQPMAASVPSGGGLRQAPSTGIRADFTSRIPLPGSTVTSQPAVRPVQPSGIAYAPQPGNADLQSQPGILRQLFPTVFAAADAITRKSPAKRHKSNKR